MKAMKLLGAAAICFALTTPVSAEDTVTIAYNAPKKSAMSKAIKTFIDEANAALAGKAKIVRLTGKKGGKNDKKVAGKVKKGQVDIGIVSINMAKAVYSPLGVFELPWMITTAEQAADVLKPKKGVGGKIKRAAGRAKLEVIGVMTRGFQYLATYDKAFSKPDDLKGLWIRSANRGYTEKALKAYGAKPGNSGGVIDSLKVISKKPKSYEAKLSYVSNVPMTFTPALIVFGKKNKKIRALLMEKKTNKKGKTKWVWNETGKKVVAAAKNAAKVSMAEAKKEDKKAWDKIKKAGTPKVVEIDLNAFREASVPLYHHYEGRVNGGFGTLNQVRELTGVNAGS